MALSYFRCSRHVYTCSVENLVERGVDLSSDDEPFATFFVEAEVHFGYDRIAEVTFAFHSFAQRIETCSESDSFVARAALDAEGTLCSFKERCHEFGSELLYVLTA
jgi:hypothetical protein